MKKLFSYLFILFSGVLSGQEATVSPILQKVDSLIKINRTLIKERSFDEALEVIKVAEQFAKPESRIYYAKCLFNHGRTYYYSAQYSKAVSYFLSALEIQENELGKYHEDYGFSLGGLANAYYFLGRLEDAAPLYKEDLEIQLKLFGEEHPDYAAALNNLALIYWALGDYEKTEPLYLESKAIFERTTGIESSQYSACLYNMALLYSDMGQFEKAERLYKENIRIKEQTEHPDLGNSFEALGGLYYELGQLEKAESYYLKALSNTLEVFGKENQNYVFALTNLTQLYTELGNFEKAKELSDESMAIASRIDSKESEIYSGVLYNLGLFHWATRSYDKVLPLFEECLSIEKKLSGEGSSGYNSMLPALAEAYEIQNKSEEAEKFLEEHIKSVQTQLTNGATFLSEKELTDYTKLIESDLHRLFNFIQFRFEKKAQFGELLDLSFENILFYKGYLLTTVQKLNSASVLNPLTEHLLNELKSYRRLLSHQYAASTEERDFQTVAELEEKSNLIEKKLAKDIASFASEKRHIKRNDIQAQLQPKEAAVEFINFPKTFPQPTDSMLYAAMVLKPGDEQPVFVPLFEEKELTKLFSSKKEDAAKELTEVLARGAVPLKKGKTKGLYKLIWEPLDSLLAGVEKVYYAPSGLLHQISFDAVAGRNKQLLSERFHLIRLGSTRALLETGSSNATSNQDIVLYGGVNYDLDASEDELPLAGAIEIDSSEVFFGFAGRSQKTFTWNFLEGSQKEVKSIAEIFKSAGYEPQIFSGASASESSFKMISETAESPKVIHIATHGFFFPKPDFDNSDSEVNTFRKSNNPMMRSGLLLAGANNTWQSDQKISEQSEDGILTAYEISQMDLSDTDLVVLSACETGLGDIEGHEGVYGLQRAFKIAGVKYLIVSLWKVPDKETANLMKKFYTNWIQKGATIPDAFLAAQKEFREEESDPFSWAGFILIK